MKWFIFLKYFLGSQTSRFVDYSSVYLLIRICYLSKSITCTLHPLCGEIAVVLKFDDLIAPACPIRLKTSSKHFQTLSVRSDVWLQHSCNRIKKRKRVKNITGSTPRTLFQFPH